MSRIRVFSIGLILVFILVLAAGPATAAPLKTNLFGMDGLFIATGGSTIPAGELAVGASMLIISDDDVDGSILPVSVTYGATSDIEIAAAFEVRKSYDDGVSDDAGTGDLHLSAKYAIQEENSDYPATAVGLRLKLPMADSPLSTEETDFILFAAVEMDMKGVSGILNVEYESRGGDFEDEVNYIVGLEIPYSDTTDFTLELVDNSTVRDVFAGGATFDMGSSMNFGVAVGFGFNDFSPDFVAMGKLNFTF